MSVYISTAVWKDSKAVGNDRLVLLAIADHADPDGSAYPGVTRLADMTRLSERTVQRCLKRLVERGELFVSPQGGEADRADRRPNLYRVLVATGRQDDTPNADGVTPDAPRGDTGRADGVTLLSPKPSIEPSVEPTPPTPPSLALVATEKPTPVEAVFDAWRESTGKHRALLDPKRRRHIAAALKSYPLEDVIDAVRGWKRSPFHAGDNKDRRIHNDLSLLLRDAEHIERFRDAERGAVVVKPKFASPALERAAARRGLA